MQTRDLVAALADGRGWSGSELARRFGVRPPQAPTGYSYYLHERGAAPDLEPIAARPRTGRRRLLGH